MLYIEFKIKKEEKFQDLLHIYPIIAKISFSEKPEPMEFWVDLIPSYSKAYFNLVDYSHPKYDRRKRDFKALIDYLQTNLEVNYKTCKEIEAGKGRLEFLPLAYPFGGMDRLIKFLKTFECETTKIDSGFGIKKVRWVSELDFVCEAI